MLLLQCPNGAVPQLSVSLLSIVYYHGLLFILLLCIVLRSSVMPFPPLVSPITSRRRFRRFLARSRCCCTPTRRGPGALLRSTRQPRVRAGFPRGNRVVVESSPPNRGRSYKSREVMQVEGGHGKRPRQWRLLRLLHRRVVGQTRVIGFILHTRESRSSRSCGAVNSIVMSAFDRLVMALAVCVFVRP